MDRALTRPRARALEILTQVLVHRKSLEHELDLAFREHPEHKAWLQEIISGVLRWKGRLEYAVDSLALRKKPTGKLRRALLLGAYPLIVQKEVNAPAVVSEMVDFIRELEGDAPARFANAILRRLAEQGAQWREAPYPSRASPQEQALWASLPDWMMKEFLKNYGEEWTRGYALASLERPELWIRHRERGAEKVETLPPLKQRDFFVQDISSQVLVDRVSAFLKDRKLKTVLDFCSAPGGKAMGLVWNGFDVTATDENSSRLKRVIENRERLQMDSLQIQNMDEIERHHEKWDAVWVDAPCTGSGILRRHPEIRWTRSAQDFQALQKLQVEILRKASQHIHPGGVLIYSVCSVLKAEGAEQIRKWLGETTPELEYTLFPQLEPHGDGFYLALVSIR